MLIKVGEKIINGNMIKRNEELKNKIIKCKKIVYFIKVILVMWGRGGGRYIEKKILKNKINFFFKFLKF